MVAIKSEIAGPDVFLAHSFADRMLAQSVARALEIAGLSSFSFVQLEQAAEWQDRLREAIAGCRAFVAVLGSSAPVSSWLAFEVGAAQGWAKPTFVVTENGADIEVPPFLAGFRRITHADLPTLVDALKQSVEPLSADDMTTLTQLYRELSVPSDQLRLRRGALTTLRKEFTKQTGRDTSPETLLLALLRLRKRGELPRVRRSASKRSDSQT